MIFEEGYLKKYATLREHDPSIYHLEELYYKVFPLVYQPNKKLFLDGKDVSNENLITVNFPEFLDASQNLALVKSVHFAVDLSVNKPDEFTKDGKNKVSMFRDEPLPEHLYQLYLGYRHTPVVDIQKHLVGVESLVSKQLAKMEDECFTWIPVQPETPIDTTTNKTSVLKYKVVFDIDVLKAWLLETFPEFTENKHLNFILHPPYMGRMTFKNSVSILYPQRTTKLKLLDKIIFKANRSFVTNNKIYTVEIIDKESLQKLFVFDSIRSAELFSNIKRRVDTSQINSLLSEELVTFDDSTIIEFSVPVPIQVLLSEHKNFKIKVIARDLTTRDR